MFISFRKAKSLIKGFLIGLFAFGLVACSFFSADDSKALQKMSEKQLFASGEMALANHRYQDAIRYLEGLQANYPFGQTAEQAQLDLIYAYFQADDYAATVAAGQHFIHLYPRSPRVDYAYYMKGLGSFNIDRSFYEKIFRLDLGERDVGGMRDSYNDFTVLLQLFPQSKYAADARQHLIYLRDTLAKHELVIANYYWQRKAYVAAANRGSYIVQHYQQSPAVKPALELMVKAYRVLGENQMAQDTLQVLALNFPKSTMIKS